MKRAIEDALNSPLLNEQRRVQRKEDIAQHIVLQRQEQQQRPHDGGDERRERLMAKFGNDFEIKWGLATDPELGNRVKVTILATGFGIENVDGMNEHYKKHSQEENERRAEEEEKAAERRAKA